MEKVNSANDLTFDLNLQKYKRKYQWWLISGIVLLGFGVYMTVLITFDSYSGFRWEYLIYILPFAITSVLLITGGIIMHLDHDKFKQLRRKLYSEQGEGSSDWLRR